MRRREKNLVVISFAAFIGAISLFAMVTWFLWLKSVKLEEARVADFAEKLGLRTEKIIVEARDMLDEFNNSPASACSAAHINALQDAAVAKPYIRAIGYWRAARRLCGVGFIQAIELKPTKADRIYESGVIAWWPSPQTEVGDVELFLMRYGSHDVAIDPRMLLEPVSTQDWQAGLWVENLPMATMPWNTELPVPDTFPIGLTVDHTFDRLVFRYSLGTIFPIDIVAIEPIGRFWDRYALMFVIVTCFGLALLAIWIYIVLRYSRHQFSLSTELKEALANGQVVAHYQPIVDLQSGRCVGAEALARWNRQDGGVVSPNVFIPIAEEAGLISKISLTVLKATMRDLGSLLKNHSDICININLAPEDMYDQEFSNALAAYSAQAGVPPDKIALEITERAVVDSDRSRNVIRAFRTLGHKVAIDDFGTGYSSLSYLQSFEIDTLKIDKSFVNAIGMDAVTSHVVGHVIELSKSLNLKTVAEGIETRQQAEWLCEQGVKHGQGYLFSHPLSADQFIEFFNAQLDSKIYPLQKVKKRRTAG